MQIELRVRFLTAYRIDFARLSKQARWWANKENHHFKSPPRASPSWGLFTVVSVITRFAEYSVFCTESFFLKKQQQQQMVFSIVTCYFQGNCQVPWTIYSWKKVKVLPVVGVPFRMGSWQSEKPSLLSLPMWHVVSQWSLKRCFVVFCRKDECVPTCRRKQIAGRASQKPRSHCDIFICIFVGQCVKKRSIGLLMQFRLKE